MAAVLTRHLEAELTAGRAEIVVEGLEQFVEQPPTRRPAPYGLFLAAQSLHWVDAGRRVGLTARALRPGGTLALIWNVGSHPDPDLRDELDRVYADVGPAVSWQPIRSTPTGRTDSFEVLDRDYGAEIAASGLFAPFEVAQREYRTIALLAKRLA